jgi:hypothetical protein
MSNNAEDLENELEALQAIYPNELTVISRTPQTKFTVYVQCEEEDENAEVFSATLLFTLTPKYPDEVPTIEIEEVADSLDEEDSNELLERVVEEATQNVGMVMVFMIVSAALEWLNARKDDSSRRKKDIADRKVREAEEIEQKRFEGTRVTVETFLKWRTAFDKEMSELETKDKQKEIDSKKLTGKELFEKDDRLNDSDLKFLEDGDVAVDLAAVKVDESLFQGLDDLDVDDEDFGTDDDSEDDSDE